MLKKYCKPLPVMYLLIRVGGLPVMYLLIRVGGFHEDFERTTPGRQAAGWFGDRGTIQWVPWRPLQNTDFFLIYKY
jgi:hypothetical protein